MGMLLYNSRQMEDDLTLQHYEITPNRFLYHILICKCRVARGRWMRICLEVGEGEWVQIRDLQTPPTPEEGPWPGLQAGAPTGRREGARQMQLCVHQGAARACLHWKVGGMRGPRDAPMQEEGRRERKDSVLGSRARNLLSARQRGGMGRRRLRACSQPHNALPSWDGQLSGTPGAQQLGASGHKLAGRGFIAKA